MISYRESANIKRRADIEDILLALPSEYRNFVNIKAVFNNLLQQAARIYAKTFFLKYFRKLFKS